VKTINDPDDVVENDAEQQLYRPILSSRLRPRWSVASVKRVSEAKADHYLFATITHYGGTSPPRENLISLTARVRLNGHFQKQTAFGHKTRDSDTKYYAILRLRSGNSRQTAADAIEELITGVIIVVDVSTAAVIGYFFFSKLI